MNAPDEIPDIELSPISALKPDSGSAASAGPATIAAQANAVAVRRKNSTAMEQPLTQLQIVSLTTCKRKTIKAPVAARILAEVRCYLRRLVGGSISRVVSGVWTGHSRESVRDAALPIETDRVGLAATPQNANTQANPGGRIPGQQNN
jgi:hypothetical protein